MPAIDWSDPEIRREWRRLELVFIKARPGTQKLAMAEHLRELAKEKPRIAELFCRGDAELRAFVFGGPVLDGGQAQLPFLGPEQKEER